MATRAEWTKRVERWNESGKTAEEYAAGEGIRSKQLVLATDAYVALSKRGKPWGQYGLDQAFERVRNRAGLAGWSVYALRHHAITMWLRRGIPVHVVQKMAGHTNLSTTQRYVHFLKGDLEDAARRLAGVGNMLETPGSASTRPAA